MRKISLLTLIKRFKWRVSLTVIVVIIEAMLGVLYPLFIGYAINDLLEKSYQGLIELAVLGACSLLVGSLRRLYDTRVYAAIYKEVSPEMVMKEHEKGSSVSTISARASLLNEFVDFLESDMPEVITAIVGIIGILVVIATLNTNVFIACIVLLLLVCAVFAVSGKLNYRLNENYNNQLEQQVESLSTTQLLPVLNHFRGLMQWKIKLSDLETANFSIIWFGIIALFLYTPVTVIESGVLSYGLVFSVLMYVFEYIQSIATCPIYIQKLIRLKEISERLSN